MKNNKFLKATFILVIGGLFTKLLGFIIKIIYTRIIGEEGISLYMLVMPSYSLMVTIAQLGLPIAISKLIAEKKGQSQRVVMSGVPIIIAVNLFIILLIIFASPYIANSLLNEPKTRTLLIAMSLVLPFISLSSLIRGYFFGKQRMMPHTVSNIIEQAFKLVILLLIIPKLIPYGTVVTVTGLILLSILSETVSIIVFLFYLPKGFKIKKDEIKPDLGTMKEIVKISIPSVSSRFVGNIGYFFEPIILMNILMVVGYSKDFIQLEYGIYNAYVLPTLLVPSFFIAAISTSLIPEISNFYASKKYEMIKRRLKQAILISLLIGLASNSVIFIFADQLLQIIYKTTAGVTYLRILCPFFLIFYLEGPLISAMQAINKSHKTLKITTIGVVIKLIILAIFSLFKIGIYGLIISEIINIIFVVIYNYKEIKKTIQ